MPASCHPGRPERAKAVNSNLGPTEEYIAPAYAGGWVPRALPRIYLVGTMRAIAPGGADVVAFGDDFVFVSQARNVVHNSTPVYRVILK